MEEFKESLELILILHRKLAAKNPHHQLLFMIEPASNGHYFKLTPGFHGRYFLDHESKLEGLTRYSLDLINAIEGNETLAKKYVISAPEICDPREENKKPKII